MAVKCFVYLEIKTHSLINSNKKERQCEREASFWAPPLSICSPSLHQALWRDKSRPPQHSFTMESIDDPLTESPKNRRHQQRHPPPPTATPQLTPPKASHSDGRRPRTSNKVHPKSVNFVLHYVVFFCTWRGHVVSVLSANESCTDEVHQKSAVFSGDLVVLHLVYIYVYIY